MFLPLRDFGKYGIIHDTMDNSLPTGAWSNGRNIRFTGGELEKMFEPELEQTLGGIIGDPKWFEQWSDSRQSYVAIATDDSIWIREAVSETEASWRLAGSGYIGGDWQSFEWGDTVIFNNGLDIPQIYDYGTRAFVDLPRWGIISATPEEAAEARPVDYEPLTGEDPVLLPTGETNLRCEILVPYRGYLIALNITENGIKKPNTVWWSDYTPWATYSEDEIGPPYWDYINPRFQAGQSEVGVGEGAITAAVVLNENLIVYTDTSATAMSFVGGNFVMNFRRLFEKGAAGKHCVAEFQNQHFVCSRDQIYVHDGSTVHHIGKDIIEDEFFNRVGAGGRFGDANAVFADFQVIKNPDRKEVYLIFDANGELLE